MCLSPCGNNVTGSLSLSPNSVTSNERKASRNSSDATPYTRGLQGVHVPLGLPDPWQAKRKSYNTMITAVLQLEKLDGNIGNQVPEVHMGEIVR